jgi:hypothetical protein
MAKSKSKKDVITLDRAGFIAVVLFVVAVTMLAVYAYMGYSVPR